MITTLPVVGNAVSGASRRRLYRHSKGLLTRLLGHRWSGPRWTLEPAIRRFLRARSQCGALAISTLTLLLAAPGSALATLTFDNFEEGACSLTANSGSGFVFDSQGGLSTANVLAGARSVQLQSGGSIVPGTSATVELVLTAGDDAAGLQFDGFTQGQLFFDLRLCILLLD